MKGIGGRPSVPRADAIGAGPHVASRAHRERPDGSDRPHEIADQRPKPLGHGLGGLEPVAAGTALNRQRRIERRRRRDVGRRGCTQRVVPQLAGNRIPFLDAERAPRRLTPRSASRATSAAASAFPPVCGVRGVAVPKGLPACASSHCSTGRPARSAARRPARDPGKPGPSVGPKQARAPASFSGIHTDRIRLCRDHEFLGASAKIVGQHEEPGQSSRQSSGRRYRHATRRRVRPQGGAVPGGRPR